MKIQQIKKIKPRPIGASAYIRWRSGQPLPTAVAIQAKCFECMGFYLDGTSDCQTPQCPLYLYMPYRKEITHGAQRHSDISTKKLPRKT